MGTEVKFAVIFVVLSFMWNCLEYLTGLQDKYIDLHPYFVTTFFILLTIVIYYLAIEEKRFKAGGHITLLNTLLTGVFLTLFILILNPLFMYLFSEFINKEFYNSFIKYDVLTGKYNLSEAKEYYNLENFIYVGTIYRFIMGIAATLILSFFIKKDIRNKV